MFSSSDITPSEGIGTPISGSTIGLTSFTALRFTGNSFSIHQRSSSGKLSKASVSPVGAQSMMMTSNVFSL
ncbi:hypothetical protein D3C76_1674220 [compost metagenome]